MIVAFASFEEYRVFTVTFVSSVILSKSNKFISETVISFVYNSLSSPTIT